MNRKQKSEKLFPFSFWFKNGFPWSKEEKNNNFTFTFSDIISIHPSHFLRKRFICQISCVNRNDRAMEKTGLISSY